MLKIAVLAIATALLGLAIPPKFDEVEKRQPETLQEKRWAEADILRHKKHAVKRIVDRIQSNKRRYQKVANLTGVPWYAIAGLHNMESSGSFRKHLHEGSPLTGRTRYVPRGRPTSGSPPFTWEESAVDALKYDNMARYDWSSLNWSLYACERYNGLGYLKYHKDVPSPYLWSFTDIYTRGKYVSDGKWSSTAVSKQCGIAAIWKFMIAEYPAEFPLNYRQF